MKQEWIDAVSTLPAAIGLVVIIFSRVWLHGKKEHEHFTAWLGISFGLLLILASLKLWMMSR